MNMQTLIERKWIKQQLTYIDNIAQKADHVDLNDDQIKQFASLLKKRIETIDAQIQNKQKQSINKQIRAKKKQFTFTQYPTDNLDNIW